MAGGEAAWSELRAIGGAEQMRAATLEDAVDGVQPLMVIEPGSPDEIARVLKTATGAGLQVIPRGGATKMDWGNPPRGGDLIISTRRLNRIVEHAWSDMTATVDVCNRLRRLPFLTVCFELHFGQTGFGMPTDVANEEVLCGERSVVDIEERS